MSGTSMDGVDFSLIKTDGINYTQIVFEKNYKYTENYRKKIKKLIKDLPKSENKQFIYAKNNEKFITDKFLQYIKKFIKIIEPNLHKIDLIGLSGQTIFHNPNKKYSLQLGSGKEIYKKIKIAIISNFRQKDLLNGGQGAPIGSFYHKSILNKINKKACIINLGGIANITYANRKILISTFHYLFISFFYCKKLLFCKILNIFTYSNQLIWMVFYSHFSICFFNICISSIFCKS